MRRLVSLSGGSPRIYAGEGALQRSEKKPDHTGALALVPQRLKPPFVPMAFPARLEAVPFVQAFFGSLFSR
jgi:hypothetical protein